MLVRPKGTNLVMMMMMTNNVGQAERHQPGDDDEDDDEGDEEEDNMPKGTNLMITKMTMTRTNNFGQATRHQPAVACPGMVRGDGTNQDMVFFLPSALGQEFLSLRVINKTS